MQNKKRFLIDTSVLLDSPNHLISLYQNGENELFISDVILKELNGHKEDNFNEKGFFAREIIRALDNGIIQNKPQQKLKSKKGKKIPKKKSNSIEPLQNDTVHAFKCILEGQTKPIVISIINREKYRGHNEINDLKIVEIAKDYGLDLITNDIALKIIALSKNIHAESLKKGSVDSPENIDFKKEYFYTSQNKDKILKEIINKEKQWSQIVLKEKDAYETGRQEFYIRVNSHLEQVKENDFSSHRIKPLNVEQKFYAKMLASNFEIMVVTGSTGSGKTLLALNEGIRRVKDKNDPIDGIVYLRNTVTANDAQSELGFRKGDQNQKLGYFAYPLYGAINFIIENSFKDRENLREKTEIKRNSTTKEDHTEAFMQEYNIEVMDIAHARGVTISNKFVIFDEIQNSSSSTLKLIGTRIGKGTRLILMGDYRQVDHPYLNKNRNALVTMLKKAEEHDTVAAIQLRNTIRSNIANWFQESI